MSMEAAATTDADKPVEIGPPHMWPEEAELFQQLLAGAPSGYLEFGLGGSTLLAIRHDIPAIVAVDSDKQWVAAVRNHAEISPRIADGRATVLHADIGPVGKFGAPRSQAFIRRWPAYIQAPWAEWERRNAFPDFVFVDGRFRVACCLSVVVAHALSGRQDGGPLVVMHDVLPERPSYAQVLEFFDVIEAVRTLQVMRVSKMASPMRALLKLLNAQFDGS